MDPLLVALVGVAIVIGGVLFLRLPAFVALVVGAILVATLTPAKRLLDQELAGSAVKVVAVEQRELTLAKDHEPIVGRYVAFRSSSDQDLIKVAELVITEVVVVDEQPESTARFRVVDGDEVLPGDLLVHRRDVTAAEGVAGSNPGERLAFGFGDTCRKIGILIAMASIIGACLLESGAAGRVVSATRAALGEQRTPLAFVISGFTVGIPVFFDTVFYLLMPLAKAMRLRTGKNYLLYTLAVVIGASMAHSLVPPTPGPLFVAASLDVSIVNMILGGTVIGVIAVIPGYCFALWANRRWTIPLRDEFGNEIDENGSEILDADQQPSATPPLWLSLMPILLPVLLLALGTITEVSRDAGRLTGEFWRRILPIVSYCGDKNIALTLAAAVAVITVAWMRWRQNRAAEIKDVLGPALASGGVIILITSAGGAFGHVLRQAGVAQAIQTHVPPSESGLSILVLAFLITAAVRVAQGSATVAMITAVGIVGPLVADLTLPYHPVYLALAVGCGSKPLPWMNDSGFWVVCRMSGMTEGETLKSYSIVITIMGFVGFAATLIGAKWLPLV